MNATPAATATPENAAPETTAPQRVLQRLILPKLPLLLTGIGFGIGLWVFALYVMAYLIAGFPPFLGFITLTWASLVGHVLFGIVVAFVVRAVER